MKYLLLLPLILLNFQIAAQDNNLSSEIYPEFEQCVNIEYANQAQCFNQTLINHIISNFEVPEIVQAESYKGQLTIIFEVDEEGEFQLMMNLKRRLGVFLICCPMLNLQLIMGVQFICNSRCH
jgi:hypothetical protein